MADVLMVIVRGKIRMFDEGLGWERLGHCL
jgi:hypothetical protein